MSIAENVRQQKVTRRRKKSGYRTKRLYLFDRDMKRLDQIAKAMGYEEKLTNEEYSAVVRTCIASMFNQITETRVERTDTKEKQYTYSMKQIVHYRKKQGDNDAEIANFMETWHYSTPSTESLTTTKTKPYQTLVSKDGWCQNWVKALSSK